MFECCVDGEGGVLGMHVREGVEAPHVPYVHGKEVPGGVADVVLR